MTLHFAPTMPPVDPDEPDAAVDDPVVPAVPVLPVALVNPEDEAAFPEDPDATVEPVDAEDADFPVEPVAPVALVDPADALFFPVDPATVALEAPEDEADFPVELEPPVVPVEVDANVIPVVPSLMVVRPLEPLRLPDFPEPWLPVVALELIEVLELPSVEEAPADPVPAMDAADDDVLPVEDAWAEELEPTEDVAWDEEDDVDVDVEVVAELDVAPLDAELGRAGVRAHSPRRGSATRQGPPASSFSYSDYGRPCEASRASSMPASLRMPSIVRVLRQRLAPPLAALPMEEVARVDVDGRQRLFQGVGDGVDHLGPVGRQVARAQPPPGGLHQRRSIATVVDVLLCALRHPHHRGHAVMVGREGEPRREHQPEHGQVRLGLQHLQLQRARRAQGQRPLLRKSSQLLSDSRGEPPQRIGTGEGAAAL